MKYLEDVLVDAVSTVDTAVTYDALNVHGGKTPHGFLGFLNIVLGVKMIMLCPECNNVRVANGCFSIAQAKDHAVVRVADASEGTQVSVADLGVDFYRLIDVTGLSSLRLALGNWRFELDVLENVQRDTADHFCSAIGFAIPRRHFNSCPRVLHGSDWLVEAIGQVAGGQCFTKELCRK